MCGIFGMVVQSGGAFCSRAITDNVRLLFRLTEPRGRQAAGLAVCRGEYIFIYTEADTASRMIERPSFRNFIAESLESASGGPTAFVGHCRLVTNGSELESRNNQPLQVNDVVGVHNGVVTNYDRVLGETLETHDLAREGDTDTEVLFGLLDRLLRERPAADAVSELYDRISGSAAIAALSTRALNLTLATNFGSLYF